jgi:hypothetical protein
LNLQVHFHTGVFEKHGAGVRLHETPPPEKRRTVKHWQRLLDGELYATTSHVDWAVLMKRSFRRASLLEVRRQDAHLGHHHRRGHGGQILMHLGVRADALARAPARDPTGQTDFDFDAAS